MKFKFTIGRRIGFGFGILIIAVLMSSILTFTTLRRSSNISEKISEIYNPSMSVLQEFNLLITNSKLLIGNWIFIQSNDKSLDKQKLRNLQNFDYPYLKSKLVLLSVYWNESEKKELDTLFLSIDSLFEIHKYVMKKLNSFESYYKDPFILFELRPMMDENGKITVITNNVQDRISKLILKQSSKVNSGRLEMLDSFEDFNLFILIMGSFLLIGGILISYLTIRSITKPIYHLKNILLMMGTGQHPDEKINERNDEIGEMTNALNILIEGLKKTTDFADEIGKGNLSAEFTPLSDKDVLGNALLNMREKLETLMMELKHVNQDLKRRVHEEVLKNRKKDMLLFKQSKQAAMGEMIGNIAHQWRQPLNAVGVIIQNFQEAYEFGEIDDDYIKTRVNKAMELVRHMSQTIDDFRNFFKSEKEKKEFNIKETVYKAISFLEASFKNININVQVNIIDDMNIIGYPGEYNQVILIIMNNAKDVFIERKIQNPTLIISIFKDDDKSVLSIIDNAGGIPEHIIDKIFEPYFTTKEQGKGTGIGLYMSKTIIEQNHNGRLYAQNVEGGAEFRIEI